MKTKELLTKPEVTFFIGLIIPLIAFAVGWGSATTRIENLETRFDYFGGRFQNHLDVSEAQFDDINSDYSKIQIQLAEIQKDILYIKERL